MIIQLTYMHFYENWQKITKDIITLNIICGGLKLEFQTWPDQQHVTNLALSEEEKGIIDLEIDKLLTKRVIEFSSLEPNQFISTLFTRPKKDGSKRMILNLKNLNKHFTYNKFKMESLTHVLEAMVPKCYMASVDLKDAYFSIPIHPLQSF